MNLCDSVQLINCSGRHPKGLLIVRFLKVETRVRKTPLHRGSKVVVTSQTTPMVPLPPPLPYVVLLQPKEFEIVIRVLKYPLS